MNSLDYQRIFHEIKNSITLINSSAQLLDKQCPQLQTEPYWDNIRHEITYLKNLILEISQAGSVQQLQKEPISLNSLLKDMCCIMKDTYSGLQWDLQLSSDLAPVRADNIKLRQAILNLLKNSAEAGSASIAIATRADRKNVQIVITDCGGGISPELESKVFELFTTSKKEGTGLGLAIAKQIIEAHKGTLMLANRPGDGCTFTISLPLADE